MVKVLGDHQESYHKAVIEVREVRAGQRGSEGRGHQPEPGIRGPRIRGNPSGLGYGGWCKGGIRSRTTRPSLRTWGKGPPVRAGVRGAPVRHRVK